MEKNTGNVPTAFEMAGKLQVRPFMTPFALKIEDETLRYPASLHSGTNEPGAGKLVPVMVITNN